MCQEKIAENLPSFYNVLCQAVKQSTLSCCHFYSWIMFIVNAQASSPYQPQCPTGFQEHSLQDPSLPPFSLVLSPAAKYTMNVIIIIKIMMVLPFWWHITQKEIKIRKPVSSSVHNLYLQSWPCSVSDLEEDLRAASAFLSTKRSSSVFTDSLDDLSSRWYIFIK